MRTSNKNIIYKSKHLQDKELSDYWRAYFELEQIRNEKECAGKLLDPDATEPRLHLFTILEAIRHIS